MTTILIVDDDPGICEILQLFFEHSGYHIHTVPGGRECIRILASTTPDLILLDIMMQPMDGWETLTAIKENPATAAIPVAIFSGKNPSPEDVIRYGGWIVAYIMKPVNFEVIQDSIREIIERVHRQQEEAGRLVANGTNPELVDRYMMLARKEQIANKYRDIFSVGPAQENEIFTEMKEELRNIRQTLHIG